MPLVVSNSSPIIHLAKIGKLDLLSMYYGQLLVPQAVWQECTTASTGRDEIEHIRCASWINTVKIHDRIVTLLRHDIDQGEAEAIALAIERKASLLLLDDAEAREKARLYYLPVTGTVGVLLRAHKEGLIPSFRDVLRYLSLSGFWLNPKLAEKLIAEVGE
jgi:hypothetical protein